MNRTEHIVAEYERRKKIYEKAGYRVHEFGYESLVIVEMYVADPGTGQTLIRKQEAIEFLGRSDFLVECRKLMALERLGNVVPRMWLAHETRVKGECRRK